MTSEIEDLYNTYLKKNKSNNALDKILSSTELETIINSLIKKLNIHNINYEDLYQNCLIASEKLIKKYDINKDVPIKAYLNSNLKYVLYDTISNNVEIKRGKGTQIKIRRAKELFSLYSLEEAKKLFKEEFDIKKDSTVDKYFYFYNNTSEILDEKDEEIHFKLTDKELIEELKREVKLTDKRLMYVISYFGLDTKKMKPSQIAKTLNCSKANVSQQLKKALHQIAPYKEVAEELKLRVKNGI